MATQRAIPGANLPESGSSTARRGRSGAEAGEITGSAADVTTELPGESGLGSGAGTTTSGFGAGDAFGTTGIATEGYGASSPQTGSREFPRAAGVIDQVKQQASTRVNEQKARAAEGLGSVASAIRQASEHLRSENQTLATYADKAVDQIQLFADRMRDKDPADMMRDAERFARRNPAAFVGGAFVLGLALARFLKSSGEPGYGNRSLVHHDTDFGASGPTPTGSYGSSYSSGYGNYTSASSVGSGITTDPAPGITS